MRVEHCYLCGGWIVAMSGMDWESITRAVRHHNATGRHRKARAAVS